MKIAAPPDRIVRNDPLLEQAVRDPGNPLSQEILKRYQGIQNLFVFQSVSREIWQSNRVNAEESVDHYLRMSMFKRMLELDLLPITRMTRSEAFWRIGYVLDDGCRVSRLEDADEVRVYLSCFAVPAANFPTVEITGKFD